MHYSISKSSEELAAENVARSLIQPSLRPLRKHLELARQQEIGEDAPFVWGKLNSPKSNEMDPLLLPLHHPLATDVTPTLGATADVPISTEVISSSPAQPPPQQPPQPRVYQACMPCRRQRVKCDLGSVNDPIDPPCVRCRRESKECYFSATKRKSAPQTFEIIFQSTKDQATTRSAEVDIASDMTSLDCMTTSKLPLAESSELSEELHSTEELPEKETQSPKSISLTQEEWDEYIISNFPSFRDITTGPARRPPQYPVASSARNEPTNAWPGAGPRPPSYHEKPDVWLDPRDRSPPSDKSPPTQSTAGEEQSKAASTKIS